MKKTKNLNAPLHCSKSRKQKKSNWLLKSSILLLMVFCNVAIIFGQNPNVEITGKITDSSGVGIPGVNITLKGTTVGTVSDIDGNYFISANSENVIVFSFIGYTTQEILVGTQSTINVVMMEDALSVEEVVVIGYGSIKKSDLTGSVAGVDVEQMESKNVISLNEGLQGLAAGVQVQKTSGQPGAASQVTIRGVATVNNSTSPLYVVDGVIVGENADFINPNDVESIEVLKDASATAIYGSLGANGVILIKTKRGKKGKTTLNVKAEFGLQTPGRTIDVADMDGFINVANQIATNDGKNINPAWTDPSQLHYIDWQDEMSKSTVREQYYLSANGGSEDLQASMSLGFLKDKGVIRGTEFKRLTTRVNVDYKVNNFIKTGINLAYTREDGHGGGNLYQYAITPPTMDYYDNGSIIHVPVRNADGTWGEFKNSSDMDNTYIQRDTDNPVAIAENAESPWFNNRVVGSAYMEIQLAKGLTFKTVNGINYSGNGGHYYNERHTRTLTADGVDQFGLNLYSSLQYLTENYFTYNASLGSSNLTLLAGYSANKKEDQWVDASARDFATSNIRNVDMTQDASSRFGNGSLGLTNKMESYFGRVNYSLMDRYVLTATIRRDGSSNFGSDNKYGTFPSAAFAWRMIEEGFMQDNKIFSNLKLRAGWGQTGNAGYATNRYKNQLTSQLVRYYFYDYNNPGQHMPQAGLAQAIEVDSNLKWETNEQVNVGLDFGFLKNSLSLTFDYFQRDAKDLLLYKKVRPSTGFEDVYTNSGHIRNKGYEFSIAYKKKFGDWNINLTMNGSHVKGEAIDVGDPIFFGQAGDNYNDIEAGVLWENYSVTRNGGPVGAYFGYKTDGILQSQAEIDALNANSPNGEYQPGAQAGDYKYVDINGDGEINSDDRDVIGDGYADLVYGFNLGVSYKNFDFTMNGHGVMGVDILSYAYMNLYRGVNPIGGGVRNVSSEYANNFWNGEGSTNLFPRPTENDPNRNTKVSDAFVRKGDFFKIQSIQIGYNLPKSLLSSVKMNSARVYFNVNNVATFSKYNKIGDPEVGNTHALANGFDGGRYPFPRIYTLGVSVGF